MNGQIDRQAGRQAGKQTGKDKAFKRARAIHRRPALIDVNTTSNKL